MNNHPGCVLYHVELVRGSRQDMILEALLDIDINLEVTIEFLDESLRMPGKRRDKHTYTKCFLLFASPEMAA